MSMHRRTFTRSVAIGLPAAALIPPSAQAIGALEIMAPAAPGGGYDRTARALDAVFKAEPSLDARPTVVNVVGAGGAIGMAQFVRTRTGSGNAMIVIGFGMIASFTTTRSRVSILDATPIARLTSENSVVVVPRNSPIQNLGQLVERLRTNPGAVSWAGGSAGGTDHILAGSIARAAGVDARRVNYVAFSGGGDSLAAIIGGQVTAGIGGLSELRDQVRAGNLRALGVSSEERIPGVELPTLREQGVDATLSNWRGIGAPPGLSPAQHRAYADLIERAVRTPSWRAQLESNGWQDAFLAGDAFRGYIEGELRRTAEVLTSLGLVQ